MRCAGEAKEGRHNFEVGLRPIGAIGPMPRRECGSGNGEVEMGNEIRRIWEAKGRTLRAKEAGVEFYFRRMKR
jgi:hypothetical protein